MNACLSEPAEALHDEHAIEQWLTTRIAALINMSADEIDVRQPFTYYGLDSLAAIGLAGDLERWLGRRLPPTLTWDYPCIELLAAHLAQH